MAVLNEIVQTKNDITLQIYIKIFQDTKSATISLDCLYNINEFN